MAQTEQNGSGVTLPTLPGALGFATERAGVDYPGKAAQLWDKPSSRPTIVEVDPPEGTPVQSSATLSFRVQYPAPPEPARAVLAARLAAGWELVFDGANFSPLYVDSWRETLSDGWRFHVRRRGGWPSHPTIWPLAYDTWGNEAL